MGTSGGDDVGAVVIDCGSWATRGGMSGDDAPRVLFPTAVGLKVSTKGDTLRDDGAEERKKGEDGEVTTARENGTAMEGVESTPVATSSPKRERKTIVGDALIGLPMAVNDVSEVFVKQVDGRFLVEDWDLMELLWRTVLKSYLLVEAKETPVLLVEGAQTWGPDGRAAAAERIFEGIGAKACFVARGAVMAAFATARSTALVVDVGAQGAFAVPVVEGYALDKSRQSSPLGGRALTEYLASAVQEKTGQSGIRAMHEILRKRERDGSFTVTDVLGSDRTETHKAFYRMKVIDQFKHAVCAIPELQPNGDEHALSSPAEPRERGRTPSYELPDGNTIDIGSEMAEKVPSALLDPNLLKDADIPGLKTARPLHKLAFDAASACDIDVRRELFGGVVLTGGSTLFPGLVERFQRDLATIIPQMFKLRLAIPPVRQERASTPWIGGSILSSLGTFQQMWMSRQEYEEIGAMGINRKCP